MGFILEKQDHSQLSFSDSFGVTDDRLKEICGEVKLSKASEMIADAALICTNKEELCCIAFIIGNMNAINMINEFNRKNCIEERFKENYIDFFKQQ